MDCIPNVFMLIPAILGPLFVSAINMYIYFRNRFDRRNEPAEPIVIIPPSVNQEFIYHRDTVVEYINYEKDKNI